MQKLLGRTSRRVKLSLYIACAIFLAVSCIPECSSSVSLSSEEKSIVIDDKDNNKSNFYQIIHVSEVPSTNNNDDDDEHVITYQQHVEEGIMKSTNDPRTIAVKSKGFDNSTSAQVIIIISQFKDSCRKNASLPSWKIDKGTTNGDFQLKINYEQRLSEGDFYLCVKNEKREQHLGLSSAFRLSR